MLKETKKLQKYLESYKKDMETGDYGKDHVEFAKMIGITPDELAEQNIK